MERAEEAAQELLRRRKARSDFLAFIGQVSPFEPAPHHRLLIEKLQGIADGTIHRLMIFMPPGHAKTTYAAVLFPPYYYTQYPQRNIIAASHTQKFSERTGRKVRAIVASTEFAEIAQFGLSDESQAAGEWETSRGGEYFAVGVGGAVTGRRADVAIIDDPIKGREVADSLVQREFLWEWYLSDLHTRLKPEAAIVLIQTRWHEDDLSGRLLAEMDAGGERWEVINLPALAEADDVLGRKPGEALWPTYIPLEQLENERNTQTVRNWSALYQQRPAPEEGDFFKRDWLRWYDKPPKRGQMNIYGASDFAVTAGGGDYTVHGVIGVNPADDIYILDWWREQTESDTWVEALLDLRDRWKPWDWALEKGQIGKSVGPFLHKRMQERRVYGSYKQYSSAHDKATRAQAIRARMSMGKVYFPRNASWVDALVDELLHFPTGKFDDQVDVLSLFGRMLTRMSKGQVPPKKRRLKIDPRMQTWDEAMEELDRQEDRPPRI